MARRADVLPMMNGAAEGTAAVAAAAPARSNATTARARGSRFGDGALYLILTVLVVGAWQFSELGYFTPESDVGYWIGVAGGVMMLLLFAYPMRKHLSFMRGWGAMKFWFVVHMVFGVTGPLLILLHSTFRIGSLNAGIALASMVIVALSGVVGRFLYLRIHHGLLSEKDTLRELQATAGFQHDAVRSRFHFVPAVEERLLAFEADTLRGAPRWSSHLRRVFVLPLAQRIVYRRCRAEVERELKRIAQARGWSRADLRKRRARARALLQAYLSAVVRVAQFSAYERLFSLWHVLHVPFVYILVISAVAHVVAVHAY